MKLRVKKTDGRTFFPDQELSELFNVEASEDGKRWTTVSTHLSAEGAEKKLLVQYGVDFALEPQLQKSLVALIQAKQNGTSLLDCLESEVLSSIHASFNAGLLTNAQAELLENRFVYADPTDDELKPGKPDECPENGEGCNECNHFLTCFPEWKDLDRAFEGL